MGPTHTLSMQITSEKGLSISKNQELPHASCSKKHFFQAHIQSRIDYASTLWDSASESLLKPLKSLHRRAVKIILLKITSLANDDYKKTTILPVKHRLMYNKARFMHKIFSGKAPTYLVKRVSINLYSRNYSRKLNVPMPRLDLFK